MRLSATNSFRLIRPVLIARGIAGLLVCLLCGTLMGFAEARPARARSAGPVVLSGGRPVHKHASKEEIETLEQQWRTAVLEDDVALMDKLLAEDYVGISMNGQVNTKLMQLDRLRTRSLRLTRMDLTDVKVKLVGTVAIVTSLAQIEGTNDGRDMTGTFRYTRVYQRLPNGTWKITNFEATRVPVPGERPARSRLSPNAPPAAQ